MMMIILTFVNGRFTVFQTCAALPALSHLFLTAPWKVSLNLKGLNYSHFNIKTEYQGDCDLPKAMVNQWNW